MEACLNSPQFIYGFDSHGNRTISVPEPRPCPQSFPPKRPLRNFDLQELLRERIAHPCPRFPAWAILHDGRPWPLLDRHIRNVLAASAKQTLSRLSVFYHAGIAPLLTGTNDLRFGFSDMPSVVSQALRAGEMRMLQRLAGWVEIRFRFPESTLEFVTGCDGWRWYYDEEGRIIATQFYNGPIEPVPGSSRER